LGYAQRGAEMPILKKKKKKARTKCLVSIMSGNDTLFTGDLMDVQFKETEIIAKSIEFFNDSQPCYIHRGAVAIRLIDELRETLIRDGECLSDWIDYPEGSLLKLLSIES
jgi:hypothetical protein